MKRFINSFKYAFHGIGTSFKGEQNIVIHIIFMISVIVFGLLLNININEWFICIILFGMVISAEIMNTSTEVIVDICMPHMDIRAKKAKDMAAASVLITAISAAIIGLLIFVPKILVLFK